MSMQPAQKLIFQDKTIAEAVLTKLPGHALVAIPGGQVAPVHKCPPQVIKPLPVIAPFQTVHPDKSVCRRLQTKGIRCGTSVTGRPTSSADVRRSRSAMFAKPSDGMTITANTVIPATPQ